MKKVIILLLLWPYPAFCQISASFESGTMEGWVESPEGRWKADSSESLAGDFSLHHIFDNSTASSDCVGIPLTDLHPAEGNTEWSFTIRHGCDPSSSNSWALFLMSDTDPASFDNGAAVSGFAVGVNLTGYDDTLRIWKVENGSVSVVATCRLNWQNDIGTEGSASIITERKTDGSWLIEAYDGTDNLKGSGSGYDPELFNAGWTVLNYRYTSTRDRLLWLDDILVKGVFYEDRIPPEITGCRLTGYNTVEITFNEDPSDDILDTSLYSLNDGNETPTAVIRKRPCVVEAIFGTNFINKTPNRLIISCICDRHGNCNTHAETEFTPLWAEAGDVMISEIMADPLPVVSLPPAEYLELTNRTPYDFDMTGWRLSTESQNTLLSSIIIKSGEYLILCSQENAPVMAGYGTVAGIKSFPALTDAGRILYLSDSSGNLIHGVEYSSDWYGNRLKEDGGWSLEMIDTEYPFFSDSNWEASSASQGGTPGMVNSSSRSNRDLQFSGLENVFPDEEDVLSLQFSETLFGLSGSAGKILIEGSSVKSVEQADPLLREFTVHLGETLVSGREYYLLLTGEIKDFAGNEITRRSFRFGLPEPSVKGNIVFNELLFNPFPDDPDYIELVNISENTIDASRLYFASINPATGDTSSVKALSDEGRCILPGSYYAVTTDPSRIIERYTSSVPGNIFSSSSLPSMPDDKGHLLLLNREMELVDEVIYSEKMQYVLLSDNEGVSLEKIRPEIPSDESMSWHSASESAGWGTPGAENSVYSQFPSAGEIISLSSGRITPNNDGVEDVLVIDLDPAGAGNVVTVTLFDERGGFVRRIKENFLAGERASIVWDGTGDDASLVRRGVYIILIEMFDASGGKSSWKRVCSVVR